MTAPQHLANKLNAQASTGPKSDAGKAISSQNAITHGLTSKQLIIPGEDPAEYEALRASLVQHYRPADEIELRMAENIAECQWRVRRLRAAEVAFYNRSIEEAMTENPDLAPEDAMALFFTDKEYRRKMSLFLRYQSAVERAYDNAIKELEKERKRRAQSGEQNGFVSHPAVPAPARAQNPVTTTAPLAMSTPIAQPVDQIFAPAAALPAACVTPKQPANSVRGMSA